MKKSPLQLLDNLVVRLNKNRPKFFVRVTKKNRHLYLFRL